MRIENPKAPITMYGVHLLRAPAPLPMMIGKSGRMHGAKTVRTPAKNERMKRVICDREEEAGAPRRPDSFKFD